MAKDRNIASGSPEAMREMAGGLPDAPGVPDLDKLGNVSTMAKVDPLFAANAKKKPSGKKFDFNYEELVPLPSGGRLYESVTDDPDVLNGFIKLRAMTVKEEEILSTGKFLKTGST